jgi:hypothetical protein
LKIQASIAANAFFGLRNDKYIKFQPHNNCVFGACIESLMTREKFEISDRKVYFFKRLEGKFIACPKDFFHNAYRFYLMVQRDE